MSSIEEVWAVVDKVPGVCFAIARLDGGFSFVVYSEADKRKLLELLSPEIDKDVDVNYSDDELNRLKKHKVN